MDARVEGFALDDDKRYQKALSRGRELGQVPCVLREAGHRAACAETLVDPKPRLPNKGSAVIDFYAQVPRDLKRTSVTGKSCGSAASATWISGGR